MPYKSIFAKTTPVTKSNNNKKGYKSIFAGKKEPPKPKPKEIPQPLTNAKNLFQGKGMQVFNKTIGLPVSKKVETKPSGLTNAAPKFEVGKNLANKTTVYPGPRISTLEALNRGDKVKVVPINKPTQVGQAGLAKEKVKSLAKEESIKKNQITDLGKTIVQAPQRALVSIGIEMPAGILSLLKKKKIEAKYQPTGKLERMLLGDESISGVFGDVETSQKNIEAVINKFTDKQAAKGMALALAPIFVGGLKALDLTPVGGSEKKAAKIIADSTDEIFINGLLKKMGVADDLIEKAAKKLAVISDEKEVTRIVSNLDALTKLKNPVIVDNVKWNKLPDTTNREVTIRSSKGDEFYVNFKPNGLIENGVGMPPYWKGKKLDEVLPKGLADKIMAQESGTLAGEGLKFGGEWANNLYDRQAPNIGKKLRGFVSTIKETLPSIKETLPNLEAKGLYKIRNTKALAIKAKNLVKDDIVKAEKYVMKNANDKAVAIASELLKHYDQQIALATDPIVKNTLLDKSQDLIFDISKKLTESGRTSQAAIILLKQTPEGQLRFLIREIEKYNAGIETGKTGILGLRKKIPNLTKEESGRIYEELKAIRLLPEGEEKFLRFKKLQDSITRRIPSPTIKQVTNIWKAGLLTGIKTTGLNISANTFHALTEIAKDVPASLIDTIISVLKGKGLKGKTLPFNLQGAGEGFLKGIKKGWNFLKTGYNEREILEKLDYNKVHYGNSKIGRAVEGYVNGIFRLLGAEDQPFYYMALNRSLGGQAIRLGKNAGLKGKELITYADNLLANPTEDMLKYALIDAQTAVFQNKTALGSIAKQVQNIGKGAGQLVVPFGMTPSAVATQIINYSPIGFVKTVLENIGKGKFDQRLFSQGMGRAITGTAFLYLGYKLAEKSLITLSRPESEKEQKLWELEGRKENSIKIGNNYRSLASLGPVGPTMLMGASLFYAYEKSGSPTEAIYQATVGSLASFKEQTFLTGINQATEALNDPENYMKAYVGNITASTIPTLINDIAKTLDPRERLARTILEKVQARIPIVREKLEPRITVLGEEKPRVGSPLQVLIDPSRPSPAYDLPVIAEFRRLFDLGINITPSQLGTKEGFAALTPEENTALWKDAGQLINKKTSALIKLDAYKKADDDKRGKAINKIVDKAQRVAKLRMLIKLTKGMKGETLKTKLSELKKKDFLTQELFKDYKNYLKSN